MMTFKLQTVYNTPGIVGDSDSVVFGFSSTTGSATFGFTGAGVTVMFFTGGAEYTTFFASITGADVWFDIGAEDIAIFV